MFVNCTAVSPRHIVVTLPSSLIFFSLFKKHPNVKHFFLNIIPRLWFSLYKCIQFNEILFFQPPNMFRIVFECINHTLKIINVLVKNRLVNISSRLCFQELKELPKKAVPKWMFSLWEIGFLFCVLKRQSLLLFNQYHAILKTYYVIFRKSIDIGNRYYR